MENQRAKPLRVLHLCSFSWETGGPANFIYTHAEYQQSIGIQVDIASPMFAWQQPHPVPSGVGFFSFPNHWLARFFSEISFPLYHWFKKHHQDYSHIHLHGLWHFGTLLPFLIRHKAQIIVSIHGALDPYALKRRAWLKNLLWRIYVKRILDRSDHLHAMNEEEYQDLLQRFPHKKSQIQYLPNGLKDPLAQEAAIPDTAFEKQLENFCQGPGLTFLFLGRKSIKKGLDLILPAFAHAFEQATSPIRLILAGPADDYSINLEKQSQAYPHLPIWYLDLVQGPEKDALYRKVDVVLLPSYSEGFSIAGLEAMAYAKACIFSQHLGFSAQAQAAQAACIIPTTVEALSQAMIDMANGKVSREYLGQQARTLYLEHFQAKDITVAFVKTFLEADSI